MLVFSLLLFAACTDNPSDTGDTSPASGCDSSDLPAWYPDRDGDGFGDPGRVAHECEAPKGMVVDNTDCNDSNPAVNPSGVEVCNEIDDDCDGGIDDLDPDGAPTSAGLWYPDADRDGYGNAEAPVAACNPPANYLDDGTDCDDSHHDVNPGGEEVCNGLDDDCDGGADELDPDGPPPDASTWYPDADGDGYGAADSPTVACECPPGFISYGHDCDDDQASAHPGGVEVCGNDIDDDCDADWSDCDISEGVDLDTYGLIMEGETAEDQAGTSVAEVGDVNADGFDDILIGAPGADSATYTDVGRTYLVLGSAAPVSVPLADVGLSMEGEGESDMAGSALAGVGDVNGDGYDDMLVGAPYSNLFHADGGAAYLILGSASLSDISIPGTARLYGSTAHARAGSSASGAGDVNGDGLADMLVGAPFGAGSGTTAGVAYVVLGSTLPADQALDDSVTHFDVDLAYDLDHVAVSSAGDVNGDGLSDILVGAPDARSSMGEAFLVEGDAALGSETLDSGSALVLGEYLDDEVGYAVASAGDVNGDGYSDMLVGDPGRGMALLFLGGAKVAELTPLGVETQITGGFGGSPGSSFASAGDLDDDGRDDLVLGLAGSYGTDDTVWALMGSTLDGDATMDVSLAGIVLSMGDPSDASGSSLAGAGDVDGDGTPDIVVGDPHYSRWSHDQGSAWLLVWFNGV